MCQEPRGCLKPWSVTHMTLCVPIHPAVLPRLFTFYALVPPSHHPFVRAEPSALNHLLLVPTSYHGNLGMTSPTHEHWGIPSSNRSRNEILKKKSWEKALGVLKGGCNFKMEWLDKGTQHLGSISMKMENGQVHHW
jgi:hypothetical protein